MSTPWSTGKDADVAAFCERFGLGADAAEALAALVARAGARDGVLGGPQLNLEDARARLFSRASTTEDEQRSLAMEAAWAASGSLPTMFGAMVEGAGGDAPADEQGSVDSVEEAQAAAASVRGPEVGVAARYQDLGVIGSGGMGEVLRVQDRDLNRVLAMKVIRPEALHDATQVSRFIQEAQIIAQLDHPGVVPAYELGRLPDGRLYFTMKEVKGKTLSTVIAEVHAASAGRWRVSQSGWTFWKLVDAFGTVCKAMAYAHASGVVHRDLKPANIMVGAFGEVLVMDWGLAKVTGQRDWMAEGGKRPLRVKRSDGSTGETLAGSVAGTPAYMPPEQARGEIERLGPTADVYALGAVLYEILTGNPPFRGEASTADVLAAVRAGTPPRPPLRLVGGSGVGARLDEQHLAPPVPEALWEICSRAMSAEPEDRFSHAGGLANEIKSWLEGDKERERARQHVARAESLLPAITDLRAQVEALRSRANALLESVRAHDPIELKRPGWAMLDQATRLERDADLREIEHIQLLRAALAQVPDLPEAHARLAEHYQARHVEAEASRDQAEAARLEAMLVGHDDGRFRAYLQGDGSLTLVTEPAGATVSLYRYQEQDRRLTPVFERVLGATPLYEVRLPRGSYLLIVRAPGHAELRYPVFLGRQDRWLGVPPGGLSPEPVRLPLLADLGPGDVYVPPGWFRAGGDPEVGRPKTSAVWLDGFVVQRFPVTHGEYIHFLDDLVSRGLEDEALRFAPRERAGTAGEQGALLYARTPDGRFAMAADDDGDLWLEDWPVMMVDWACANAYAAWLSARTGLPWRLPHEIEWEKAARGVDGRFFPWGDFLDPTWCRMRDSVPGKGTPAVVDSYPVDESPYGVRGMAGNCRDWCADVWRPAGPRIVRDRLKLGVPDEAGSEFRVFRGGAWNNPASACRSAYRSTVRALLRYPVVGIRLVRSWPA